MKKAAAVVVTTTTNLQQKFSKKKETIYSVHSEEEREPRFIKNCDTELAMQRSERPLLGACVCLHIFSLAFFLLLAHSLALIRTHTHTHTVSVCSYMCICSFANATSENLVCAFDVWANENRRFLCINEQRNSKMHQQPNCTHNYFKMASLDMVPFLYLLLLSLSLSLMLSEL